MVRRITVALRPGLSRPGALLVLCLSALCGPATAHDDDERAWSVSVFAGAGSHLAMSGTIQRLPDIDDSGDRIAAVALSREVLRFDDSLGFELEGMAAHHFGRENYQEVGTALYARWHSFPWNAWLTTTMALGMGPSYTTIYPVSEFEPGASDRSRVLNQFNLEITLGLPSTPDTSLLLRLQHRSGIFGVIDHGSSDFLTMGLRRHF